MQRNMSGICVCTNTYGQAVYLFLKIRPMVKKLGFHSKNLRFTCQLPNMEIYVAKLVYNIEILEMC